MIEWDTTGERLYEFGVDRVVVYNGLTAEPWNGVTNIAETSNAPEPREYFLDGVKYNNHVPKGDFSANIEAYSNPNILKSMYGDAQQGNGLVATNQGHREVSISYRTLIGNDVSGDKYGYKLHLVYNATIVQDDRAYKTNGDNPEPSSKKWRILTRPATSNFLFKNTAHFYVDSPTADKDRLEVLESILYGYLGAKTRFPTVDELVAIMLK